MKLRELLALIEETSIEHKTSRPYICGGAPRDRFMNRLDSLNDIDITTGDATVFKLAKEVFLKLKKKYKVYYKVAKDGHASIYIGSGKIDFSSNFNCPNIDGYLKEKNIEFPTDMQRELFSRDFTCNSLLMTFDLKNIIDPTKRGFEDIKNKVIRSNLPPAVTLTANKNRVIRSLYLAAKLDFIIDDEIVDWVSKNQYSLKISTENALLEKLNKAMSFSPKKTVHYIDRMALWDQMPITKELYPYYKIRSIKRKF
jgi:tRNA nucleotidyltransferase/poly(A) polymerase